MGAKVLIYYKTAFRWWEQCNNMPDLIIQQKVWYKEEKKTNPKLHKPRTIV